MPISKGWPAYPTSGPPRWYFHISCTISLLLARHKAMGCERRSDGTLLGLLSRIHLHDSELCLRGCIVVNVAVRELQASRPVAQRAVVAAVSMTHTPCVVILSDVCWLDDEGLQRRTCYDIHTLSGRTRCSGSICCPTTVLQRKTSSKIRPRTWIFVPEATGSEMIAGDDIVFWGKRVESQGFK